MLPSLGALSAWVTTRQYEQAAINTFLEKADFYLVAYAHAHGHVVVTHETPSSSTKKIKIPEPCIGLGIKFVNTFEMLRYSQARFVLPTHP
jgi:hypothetical protein